jgi:hypothetical protein
MRAGTSWLAENLRRHPDIWIGRKEIHFFDRKIDKRWIPWLDRDREARLRYAVRFLPGTLRHKVTGEFTPRYAILDQPVIARIHSWIPDVRLLLILREPVERAWSQARHDYRVYRKESAAQTAPSELADYFNTPAVRQRGDYAACLKNWLSVFDREQILVLFLEEARANPLAVLREAFTFLGVDSNPEIGTPVLDPVHAGVSAPMPEEVRHYLSGMFGGQRTELESLIGRPVPWASTP